MNESQHSFWCQEDEQLGGTAAWLECHLFMLLLNFCSLCHSFPSINCPSICVFGAFYICLYTSDMYIVYMFSFHVLHNTASTDFTLFLNLIKGAEVVLIKFKLIYLQYFITCMFHKILTLNYLTYQFITEQNDAYSSEKANVRDESPQTLSFSFHLLLTILSLILDTFSYPKQWGYCKLKCDDVSPNANTCAWYFFKSRWACIYPHLRQSRSPEIAGTQIHTIHDINI